ncbi:MAG: radical SAM protein [bacterium]|nr:radical SAM protein [bacterium]
MSHAGRDRLRVAFETLGCRSNFADTVDLQLACAEKGAAPIEFSGEADVYVINTCTVTDGADKDVRKIVRRLRERKPEARIVITGCLAEVEEGRSFAEDEGFQVIGTGRRNQVVEAIFSADSQPSNRAMTVREQKKRKSISLDQELPDIVPGPHGALGEIEMRSRFHLRVQEGCDSSCTYCIIPRTRGALSSRPLADVLADAKKIYAAGYSEVVLTGTHLGGYGEDAGISLTILLKELLALDLPLRYRLSSLDPDDVSLELLDVWQESARICRHFHICLQALDD